MVVAKNTRPHRMGFAYTMLIWQVLVIILYGVTTDFADTTSITSGDQSLNNYPIFQDIHVMLIVGFGFLMSFLTKYGHSAVAFNLYLSALTIQWGMLVNAYWKFAFDHGRNWHRVELDINSLIEADFSAITVAITFGALLGKVSPIQMFFIMVMEVAFAGLNKSMISRDLDAVDYGGALFVHVFGALFGIACSTAVSRQTTKKHATSASHTNTFSMIGTLFLWVYWPSFNAASVGELHKHRVIVNTVASLSASCISAFFVDAIARGKQGKFCISSIQHATLAGGVAAGSIAAVLEDPWVFMLLGMIAGGVSVLGLALIGPRLRKAFGITDTCDVLSLHGLPGLLAALAGIISCATAKWESYGIHIGSTFPARSPGNHGWSANTQAAHQTYALLITVGIAVVGGILTGMLINVAGALHEDFGSDDEFFSHDEEQSEQPQAQMDVVTISEH